MIVYVLNHGFDYEGERTMGVFKSFAKASAAAIADALPCYDDDLTATWHEGTWYPSGDAGRFYKIYKLPVVGAK